MSQPIAHVHNPDRQAEWLAVLGTDEIPIISPIPLLADLPDQPNSLVYEMDIDALNSDQLMALIRHLAEKFRLEMDYTRAYVINNGVPILANDVTVIGSAPWWL